MWLLPTLNRLEKLQTFLNSAIATRTSTPGRILVDMDDYDANREAYEALRMPSGWRVVDGDGVTMGDKCRESVLLDDLEQEWVGILNDDHFCVTACWDQRLIAKLDGTNFVSANDRWIAPTKATTATAWSMPLLRALGWPIYPPGLQHLFIDDLWENLGRATGCWRPVMSAVVEHHHVLNGRGKDDDTHQKVYAPKAWDHDRAIFDNFMKYDFADCVEKIKKLQNKPPAERYNPLVRGKDYGQGKDQKSSD